MSKKKSTTTKKTTTKNADQPAILPMGPAKKKGKPQPPAASDVIASETARGGAASQRGWREKEGQGQGNQTQEDELLGRCREGARR
jgi:hypothetical protein